MTIESFHNISVIGLGKLGAPLAAVLARTGHTVIGVDVNTETIHAVNKGIAPVTEPQLQTFMDQAEGRLSATNDFQHAVTHSDITFIIVPTPSDDKGYFSNAFVVAALKKIGAALQKKDSRHLVVVSSTVMPGAMDGELKTAIEETSNKTVGSALLGMCYNPEFIALGNIINNMLHPDFMLIGESDQQAGDLLQQVHQTVCGQNTPFHRMNFINAEITKISVNTYVTTKISYANMLAEICENIPGANVDVVTDAVGSDTRIGKKYLKGAIGYGGPCFPRDNRAFAALGQSLGANCDIAVATDTINERQLDRLVKAVKTCTSGESAKVAVLGLAYKTDTPEIEHSQGMQLCERLHEMGYHVTAHDPQAGENAAPFLTNIAQIVHTPHATMEDHETIIITTPWNEYRALDFGDHTVTLIDPWGLFKSADLPEGVTLISLGRKNSV